MVTFYYYGCGTHSQVTTYNYAWPSTGKFEHTNTEMVFLSRTRITHLFAQNTTCYLLDDGQRQIVPAGTEAEDGLLGLGGGDARVVRGLDGLEGGLELGLIVHLLLQVEAVDDRTPRVEHNLENNGGGG